MKTPDVKRPTAATPPRTSEPGRGSSVILLLNTLGWLLRWTPEVLLQGLSGLCGDTIYRVLPRRRRIVLANLRHAFPELGRAELVALAQQSCRRMTELGVWLLIARHLSPAALARRVALAPGALETLADTKSISQDPEPSPQPETPTASRATKEPPIGTVVALPHVCTVEMLTAVGGLPGAEILPPVAILYRSLNQPSLDAWVRHGRERWGFQLFARDHALSRAVRLLRRGGILGVLFDQHTLHGGLLTTSFDRPVHASPACGHLAAGGAARLLVAVIERDSFLSAYLRFVELPTPENALHGAVLLEQWLENWLRQNPEQRSSWLWMHHRWKAETTHRQPFRLQGDPAELAATAHWRGWATIPRQTRFWVVLPPDAAETAAALPFLAQLRHSRPDAAFTIVGTSAALAEAQSGHLPAESWRLYPLKRIRSTFQEWSWEFPAVVVNLCPRPRTRRHLAVLRGQQTLHRHPPRCTHQPTPTLPQFFTTHGLPSHSA